MDMKGPLLPVRNRVVFLCLALAVFLVYRPALKYGFIMDDKYLIVQNSYVKDVSLWPRIFGSGIFHFHPREPGENGYYRPLQSLSYAFEYGLWKLNAGGYRATNILIHSLNAFLFFLLVTLLFKDRALALAGAFVFALLPSNPCVVVFVAGRSDLLQTFFFLASLLLFCRFHSGEAPRARVYLLSLACFVLALLTREGALLLPVFLALCVLFMERGRRGLRLIIPYAAIACAYLLLRSLLLPSSALSPASAASWQRLAAFARLNFTYFSQLVLPLDAQLFLKEHGAGAFFAAVSALLAVFFAARAFRERPSRFAALFFLAGLLPLLKLAELRASFGKVITEHYSYISSMGFALLIAAAVVLIRKRSRALGNTALALVLALYAGLTVAGAAVYRDEPEFYAYVLRHDPQNTLALRNLANYYLPSDVNRAEELARRAAVLDSRSWHTCQLLGNIARLRGDTAAAEAHFTRALELNPLFSDAAYSLGMLYAGTGQEEKAKESFEKAFRLDPDSEQGLGAYGEFLLSSGENGTAVTVFSRLSRLQPRSAASRVFLGVAYALEGNAAKARESFLEALRLDPRDTDARRNLGSLYANSGDLDAAMAQWKEALAISPGNEELITLMQRAQRLKEAGGSVDSGISP